MSGTMEGGAKAAKANKEKYGEDYYKRIGAMGGKNGTTGGFGQGEAGRKRARLYGAIGGSRSRKKSNAESR